MITKQEFYDVMKEMMGGAKKELENSLHPVIYENNPFSSKYDYLLLVTSSYKGEKDLIEDTGVIIRVSYNESHNTIGGIYTVSPLYTYDGFSEDEEVSITRKISSILEDVLRVNSIRDVRFKGIVICKTGDVKVKLNNIPELPKSNHEKKTAHAV